MIENINELREHLEREIKRSSRVFIVGHDVPDLPDIDAIGSAMALHELAAYYGKEAYIVLGCDESKIDPLLKSVIDRNREAFHIIRKKDFLELVNKKSLLILSDVNKSDRISVGDSLDRVGRIIVIDHHNEGPTTVPTKYKYISLGSSSASEIMTILFLGEKIPMSTEVANNLLAGVYVDSKNFEFNTTDFTHEVRKRLIKLGANPEIANNFLKDEYETYCRVKKLVINGTVFKKYSDSIKAPINVAFTLNREKPRQIYFKEDFAKAANDLVNLSGINAGFAMGYVEPGVVHVSARSGKRVNVEAIMKAMGGGGNAQLAGGRFATDDIFALENELMGKVQLGIMEEPEEETQSQK